LTAIYLMVAIVSEVIGTLNVKLSHGFTRLQPSATALICYAASTYLLSLAVKRMEVSVAYAIWCAVGTALIATAGIVWFKESLTPLKVVSLCLVIAGVVGLNLAPKKPAPVQSIPEAGYRNSP